MYPSNEQTLFFANLFSQLVYFVFELTKRLKKKKKYGSEEKILKVYRVAELDSFCLPLLVNYYAQFYFYSAFFCCIHMLFRKSSFELTSNHGVRTRNQLFGTHFSFS